LYNVYSGELLLIIPKKTFICLIDSALDVRALCYGMEEETDVIATKAVGLQCLIARRVQGFIFRRKPNEAGRVVRCSGFVGMQPETVFAKRLAMVGKIKKNGVLFAQAVDDLKDKAVGEKYGVVIRVNHLLVRVGCYDAAVNDGIEILPAGFNLNKVFGTLLRLEEG